MNNGIPYIYLLTDIRNGKQYVGKSCGKYYYFTGGKIPNKIIKKYGKDIFIKEILDSGSFSNAFLNELEKHYIKVYDTYKYGYNLTLGGDDGSKSLKKETREKINKSKHKKIYMFDLEGSLINSFNSIKEANIKFNLKLNDTTINKCLYSNRAFLKKYQFSFKKEGKIFCNKNNKILEVYKEDILIGKYRNATEASEELNISMGSIHYFVNKGYSKKHNFKFLIR